MYKNRLPIDIVDQWPEVLVDIDAQVIPTPYLKSVRVVFREGKAWVIDVAKRSKSTDPQVIEDELNELIYTYRDSIDYVDFQLDVNRIKKDMSKLTNKLLNKRRSKK